MHISVILALMALTKTVQYYLARFALTLSHRGVVDGATYTDVKAQLPALNLLMLISVAAAILFIVNIFRKGWVFPIIAVGLWGFISIVVGTIYPGGHPALRRAAERVRARADVHQAQHRRDACRVRARQDHDRRRSTTTPTSQPSDVTAQQARRSTTPGSGIRPRCGQVLSSRPRSSQPYYPFSDVDVDRYDIDGERDARRSPACASSTPAQLPSNTWTNRHLVYTHGYGVDSAQANAHNGDSARATCSPTSRRTGELAARRSPTSTSARASAATRSSTPRSPSRRRTASSSAKTTQYKGDGGVKVVEPRAPARVRAALRRLQPRVLGPAHAVSRGSSTSATSRSGCRPRRRSCSGTPTRTRSC